MESDTCQLMHITTKVLNFYNQNNYIIYNKEKNENKENRPMYMDLNEK